jgi:diguanylate cyclase (GGDEF)-like protein/PAS domain S-box-containing protein
MASSARLKSGAAGHVTLLPGVNVDAIMDAMPDCVKIFDDAANLIYINPKGLELVEAPDLATLNRSDHLPVGGEYLPLCFEVHARVMGGESVSWSYEVIGMKGARRHVEAHSVPLTDGARTVAHLCISRDASQRQQAEDALQRLRLIQEATGLVEFETDEGGITSSNDRFFEQIGLPAQTEPIMFADWLQHVHPDDRQRLHEEVRRGMREDERIECDFRIVRADTGEVRWLETHTGVERNDAGEVVRTIGAHLDVTERKRTENALRESQARLSAILHAVPDCVKIFDEQGQLTYINSCGTELGDLPGINTAVEEEQVTALPGQQAERRAIHQKVIAGESLIWSFELTDRDGELRHFEAHSAPVELPDGTTGHMCIARDITERKKAADALRRSEERLRLVQDVTGLADFEAGDDGVAHCSRSFLRQLGLPDDAPTAMKFDDWIDLVHAEDRDRLRAVERSLGQSDTAECDFRVVRADTGEVRWISSKLKLERDPRGNVLRSIGAHLDVTDRRRAEEGLRESEARLRAILDAMPDCVKIFNDKAELIYINPCGLELLEAPDLETLNTSGHIPVPAEFLAGCVDVHNRVIAGETIAWNYEIVGMRGRRCHVEAHAVPFTMPDGAAAHMCISRDITERKRAEDALRLSEQRLRLVQDATGLAEFETGAEGLMVGSARFFEQLGLPVADGPVPAKAWAVQVHPDDLGWLVEALDRAIAEGEPDFSAEFRIVRADTREIRWLASSARMEYAEDGSVTRTIGAHLDITERKRAEQAVRASEERLRLVQEATGLADFEAGPGGVARFSESMAEQMGMPPGTTCVTVDELMAYIHPDDREMLRGEIERGLTRDETFQCEFRIIRGDTGEVRWIHSRTKVDRDAKGVAVRSIGAHLDITDRKLAEEALRESEERFRLAAEAAGFGVWDYDEENNQRQWSDRLREILGIADEVLSLSQAAEQCIHPGDRERFIEQAENLRTGKIDRYESAYRINRKDDRRERWIMVNAWRTQKAERQSRRIIMTVRDVTEEKTAEERIRWSASHDPLTRLANRSLFQQQLEQAIRHARSQGKSAGVLLLDLDHFKQINDSLGHDVGDALLKMFAERLRSVVRARDTVARLGGDEFAIVVPDLRTADDLVRLSHSIQERMRAPFVSGGRVFDCRVSSGAAMYPKHGSTSREVLKNADVALYAAKGAGRATVMMYDAELRNDMQRRLAMVQLARNAINNDRVIPYYQPKLDLQSGTIEGFEALLRWRTPSGRIASPAALEAAFEDLEVAAAISDRMIDRVIADMRGWLDRGIAFKHVAVNASAAEFRSDNFAERVLERLARANIPTRCFQIEVTETVFLGRGAESVHRALALLNARGVKIALDDFGTGYASLRHLKKFPVDIIKIDQSFVRDMEVDPGDEAIVRAVINLGKSLGIHVVAEGIEVDAQMQRLVRLNCDFGQGFLFSKAVPARRVPTLVGQLHECAAAHCRRPAKGGLRVVGGHG